MSKKRVWDNAFAASEEERNGSMAYFVLANGEKLYYEDTDAGEKTLVMLHGWTSSHEIYEKPVDLLKDKVRCITYDHRGHGGSKDANGEQVTMETLASDLHELLEGMDLPDVNLLGWSMGAGVVMTYLERYGTERLRQIILCDMTPKQINDDEWKLGLYQGAYTAQNMADDAGKPFFGLYKEFAIGAMPKLKKLPGIVLNPGLKKKLSACDESVLASLAASMKAQDHRGCFADLDIPLTYFFADPGSLFSPELAKWYEKSVPSPFKAVRFQNATHMLIDEYPEKFATEVATLL